MYYSIPFKGNTGEGEAPSPLEVFMYFEIPNNGSSDYAMMLKANIPKAGWANEGYIIHEGCGDDESISVKLYIPMTKENMDKLFFNVMGRKISWWRRLFRLYSKHL